MSPWLNCLQRIFYENIVEERGVVYTVSNLELIIINRSSTARETYKDIILFVGKSLSNYNLRPLDFHQRSDEHPSLMILSDTEVLVKMPNIVNNRQFYFSLFYRNNTCSLLHKSCGAKFAEVSLNFPQKSGRWWWWWLIVIFSSWCFIRRTLVNGG